MTDEDIAKYEKYNNKPLVVVVDDDKLSVAIENRRNRNRICRLVIGYIIISE